MKPFEMCQDEAAMTYGFNDFDDLKEPFCESLIQACNEDAAKIYAEYVANNVRQRCFYNDKCWVDGTYEGHVDENSILNTEIFLP